MNPPVAAAELRQTSEAARHDEVTAFDVPSRPTEVASGTFSTTSTPMVRSPSPIALSYAVCSGSFSMGHGAGVGQLAEGTSVLWGTQGAVDWGSPLLDLSHDALAFSSGGWVAHGGIEVVASTPLVRPVLISDEWTSFMRVVPPLSRIASTAAFSAARPRVEDSRSATLDPAVLSERDFNAYLSRLQAPAGEFTAGHVDRIHQIWARLRAVNRELPLPVAIPTGDGGLQLSWTRGQRHASVDIYDGEWHWFYRDRSTGECDGGEGGAGVDPTEGLVRRIALVTEQRST